MKGARVVLFTMLLSMSAPLLWSETLPMMPAPPSADSQLSSRIALSAGMGVEYVNAGDVVDFVNSVAAGYGARQRMSDFKSAVQFFGAIAFPLSRDWVLKAEYVYLLASYNPDIPGLSFTLNVHMPSIILQYILLDGGLYNIKLGGGLGYHIASLTNEYYSSSSRLSAGGIGAVIDLEANTAFGEHLFGYLGGDIRGEFIGKTTNTTSGVNYLSSPTVHTFSIGARLGLSYYF